ncbi:MAG: ATP synthase F1 subunit delta [Gemmataceae bacterium]|nr:ATP synthase F1 subunit delta [Gemmataceae bacterium]
MTQTRGPDQPPILGEEPLKGTSDVGAQRIARVYAESLYSVASKQGQAAEVLEEVDSLIRDVFRGRPQLELLITGSAIGRTAKEDVIKSAFAGRASDTFLHFLYVLNHHDRLDLLRTIHSALHQIDNERNNRIRVHVQTATPLADDQRERLTTQLGRDLQAEVTLDLQVDPDLLGGMVVRAGDYVYDHSVRTQLATFRKELIERMSHEIQSRRDRFRS